MVGKTGRLHKPTHLKLVTGTIRKDRRNKAEAKPNQRMPAPPEELSVEARAEWDRKSRQLFTCGLLTVIDDAVLAAYCQAFGRWKQAERALGEMTRRDLITSGLMIKTHKGNVIQNPLVGTANKAMHDMVRYAAELGMTPSARSRVKADTEKTDDDAERFF